MASVPVERSDDMQVIGEKSPDDSFVENAKQREIQALDEDEVYSRPEQRKIIHRIDRRLITTTGAMYCVSLMDRTNLPNAAIAGMNDELDLDVGFRYVSALPLLLSDLRQLIFVSRLLLWCSS